MPTEREFSWLEKQIRRDAEFRQLRRKHRREDIEENIRRVERQQEELAEIIQQCEALPSFNEMDEKVVAVAKEKMERNRQWIARYKQRLEEE